MAIKENSKKTIRMTIFIKFLLISAISTSIPLLFSGIFAVFSYEEVIEQFLAEQKAELSSETYQHLLFSLSNIRAQIALSLSIIIVLTLFSVILMARNLTRPLKDLIKGIKEIARGNLDYTIKVETEDELGEVADHLNQMTQQMKKAKISSEETKATLEIKVKARTKELRELASGLEDQIKERTRELQERITELEKFHRLTVGRELKMVELKREIEKLGNELEKAKKEKTKF